MARTAIRQSAHGSHVADEDVVEAIDPAWSSPFAVSVSLVRREVVLVPTPP